MVKEERREINLTMCVWEKQAVFVKVQTEDHMPLLHDLRSVPHFLKKQGGMFGA